MQPEELLYKEAMEAVNNENFPLARELMTRLLQRDRLNAQYWVWMSALVDTVKERNLCLREAHKLDPNNPIAIRGLRLMGEDIPDPKPLPELDPKIRRWKTSLEIAQEQQVRPVKQRKDFSSWVTFGLVMVALGGAVFLLLRRPRYQPDTSPILKFSLTPPATATQETTPLPIVTGPVPLWMQLEATYTATPIYAATPHRLTEAYQAAMRAYERQNWAQALEFFEQVLYSEPASPDVRYHMGEIYRFQGLADESAEAYDESIRISPTFAPAYVGRGRAFLMVSPPKVAKAQEYFEKALELDPMQFEAYYELAQLDVAEGDAQGALDTLDRIPDGAPATVLAEVVRAEAYLLKGEPDSALESAQAANRIDVTYLPVYKLLAQAYQMKGLPEDSMQPLMTYLTWVQDDPEAFSLMATILVEQGELEEALGFAEKALAIDKNSIPALLARGEIYLKDGKAEEAAVDFNAAIRQDKNSYAANLGIARVQIARELFGSAYEYARVALQLAQGDRQIAAALYYRALALIGLDEERAALRDLETLLALPAEVLPEEIRQGALETYRQVITPTPTFTPRPTVYTTPVPTKDLPPAITATPTATPRK